MFHEPKSGRDYLFYQGDNTALGIKWHLSMLPIRWTDVANGSDVPVLDPAALR